MSSHFLSIEQNIIKLANRHDLELAEIIDINELGLDFRVVTATDSGGTHWILRIPRRTDVLPKIGREARNLSFLGPRVPFAVPNWRIVSDELVAYPKLTDPTAIHFDVETQELTWNMDKESDTYVTTLGSALAALHQIPIAEAVTSGIKSSTPNEVRQQIATDIARVKTSFEVALELERRWKTWLDNNSLWPRHSVVVHGDLYAGHVLVNEQSEVTGVIDWTEAEVSDPAIDFSSHLMLFGEVGLTDLIRNYEAAGGQVWPNMVTHIAERLALAPLKYALFAIESGDAVHTETVKAQLLQS